MKNEASFTEAEKESVERARQELIQGQVVAIPTETVYGLAANAYEPAAVQRVFQLKKRPAYNPLIVHIGRLEQLQDVAVDIPPRAHSLIEAFWPGPLTLLLKKSGRVTDHITAGKSTVAVRMPRHPLTLNLLRRLPFPLVAPSANRFNHISPTQARHVKASLGTEAPYILDGGPCTLGIESTIIGFESGRPVLYRWGAISREEIKAIAGPVSLYELESDDIRSPGQLQKHYSPHTPLELCTDIPARLAQLSDQRVGLILWTTKSSIPHQPQIVLSPKGDINEAAHHLFAALHQMDQSKLDIILAETVPPKGVGRAINDRLRKAAAR